MNKISIILMALLMLALTISLAPSILRMNQGKMLRNIALWVALVLGLALVYQNTDLPQKMGTNAAQDSEEARFQPGKPAESGPNKAEEEEDKADGEDQSYTPPHD